MSNVIQFPPPPPPLDPWRFAQPSYKEEGDRFELWSAPYFGVEHLIFANGSNEPPDPPTQGGTPRAANLVGYTKLRAVA